MRKARDEQDQQERNVLDHEDQDSRGAEAERPYDMAARDQGTRDVAGAGSARRTPSGEGGPPSARTARSRSTARHVPPDLVHTGVTYSRASRVPWGVAKTSRVSPRRAGTSTGSPDARAAARAAPSALSSATDGS